MIGCVAWLTSHPILHALAKKKGVSIIVQKEDFLRPDISDTESWKYKLRELYKKIPSTLSRFDAGLSGTVLSGMSYGGDWTIEAIRCVGNHNSKKNPAWPRMHHKFIVFFRETDSFYKESDIESLEYRHYEPYEVWTGSFNFSKNAGFSFENAVVLKDAEIVRAFFREYTQVAALSEPLNWESEWVAPEWRVGS